MSQAKKLMAAVAFTTMLPVSAALCQENPNAFSFTSDLTDPSAETSVEKDQIQAYEELISPFTHAVSFAGREGLAYMSQNGRFVLRGVIFDTWTGKTIQTFDELQEAKQSMNLKDLGLKDEDVDPLYFGTGSKNVTVFVDPLCPFCGQLFDQILADPSYERDYTFTIYTVPFLGAESERAVTAVSCHKDRQRALLALMSKDKRWMLSNPPKEACDPQPIIQRTILSQMLGVTGVPYIIGAEGGVARGMPADLKTFLNTN